MPIAICKCQWKFPFERRTDRRTTYVGRRISAYICYHNKEPMCGKRLPRTNSFRCDESVCIPAGRCPEQWHAIHRQHSKRAKDGRSGHRLGRCILPRQPCCFYQRSCPCMWSSQNVSPIEMSIRRPSCRQTVRWYQRISSELMGRIWWHSRSI